MWSRTNTLWRTCSPNSPEMTGTGAVIDEAKRGDVPERGSPAIAEHKPRKPSGNEKSSLSPARTRPTKRLDWLLAMGSAHERWVAWASRSNLLWSHLGRSRTEAAVGWFQVSRNQKFSHG